MSPPALITQADWNDHVELEGRLIREHADLARVTKTLRDEVIKLTEEVRQINRKQRKQDRALESWNDLAEESKAAEVLRMKAEIKRLRSLPAQVAKWLGWAVGFGVGLAELYKAFH